MNEAERDEEKTKVPAQQAEQIQPAQASGSKIGAASADAGISGGSQGGATDSTAIEGVRQKNIAWDEARFTARIGELYGTILKEPVPEEMLRLIDQLAELEDKSGKDEMPVEERKQQVQKLERE